MSGQRRKPTIYSRLADPELQRNLLERGTTANDLLDAVTMAWKVSEVKRSVLGRLGFALLPGVRRQVKAKEEKIAKILDEIEGKPPVRG